MFTASVFSAARIGDRGFAGLRFDAASLFSFDVVRVHDEKNFALSST